MTDLNERQQAILSLIVQEHIRTAEPVGSHVIARRYRQRVSSATVRNEMALLEELGYLTHPYTSAGRIPTDRGYRYFVERLMEEAELPVDEQRMIRHQFHQASGDLDRWLRLAASVLAQTAHNAALVTPPQAAQAHLRHIDLVAISPSLVLLVLVLREGLVKQQMIDVPQPPLDQDELNQMAHRLSSHLHGLSAKDIEELPLMLTLFEKEVVGHIGHLMGQMAESSQEVYRDGLDLVLRQPEFRRRDRVEQIIRVLEHRRLIDSLLDEVLASGGVHIIIGGEGRWREIDAMSLVVSRYGRSDLAAGLLGVVGPLRMPYSRAISTVRYVASLMDDMVYRLFGS